MSKKIITISGKSNAGKDFIAKVLETACNLKKVSDYSTRPMRAGEVNGREHNFITDEEMDKILADDKNVVAYSEGLKYRYATTVDGFDEGNLYIVDPIGLEDMQERYPDWELYKICIIAPLAVRVQRAKEGRSDFEKEFNEREARDTAEFMDYMDDGYGFDLVVSNGTEDSFTDNLEVMTDHINAFLGKEDTNE